MVSFHPWLTNFSYQLSLPVTSGGIVNALFLGFSAAMLGISFESSSNFVEEQEQGCFLKHYETCGPLSVFLIQ
jgi:hypothetical protein